MPKIGNANGPGPINNPLKPEKKTKTPEESLFFNPNVKAKSLKGRVGVQENNSNMTELFKKISSS